jgi:8-oxo-dGTP pyrophosphatase MutT (NUDIX family)
MPSLASGVLFFRDDLVLLVHQAYGRHLWTTPGGMLEPGEGPDDAARREVLEELGVDSGSLELTGVYHVRRSTRRSRIGFMFVGHLDGDEVSITDAELDDIGWFPVDRLPEPCSPGLDQVISDARANERGVVGTIIDDSP